MSDKELVHLERDGDVGVIVVDNPPVNALSPGVPEGIIAGLNQFNADPAIKAIVLIGAGRSFIAGADIRQFGKGRVRPAIGTRTYDVMDRCEKPIVAAIHGYALGGGLENAMGCHYRLAKRSAKVGLPEVLIGILPGGNGTQRLPRLIGARRALDMIVTGRHVPADEALAFGILDQVIDDTADLKAAGIAMARAKADIRPLPRVRDRTAQIAEYQADPGMFDAMRKSIARKARNQKAPYNCIAAVEAACTLPFDQGVLREQELFLELENSDEARALRYAFFAERESARIPGLPDNTAVKDATHKALTAAAQMGGDVHVLVAGNNAGAAAAQAAKLDGVKKVLHVDSATFERPLAEPMAALVVALAPAYDHIVSPATGNGKNFMPRVAALLDVMQVSDIAEVKSADTFVRLIYAGNAVQTVQSTDAKKVITVRTASFPAAGEGGSAEVVKMDAPQDPGLSSYQGENLSKSDRPELTSARIVVSGGRGMQNGDNFKLLDSVASKLNAAVGASRAAVDAGYVPNDYQVGQTGKVVAPDLYIAVGISGAIQHLAGMKDSKIIVAINKDEEAPIFQVADYGLVADLFTAVPELDAELAKLGK